MSDHQPVLWGSRTGCCCPVFIQMVSLLDWVATADQVDALSPLDPFVYQPSVGIFFLLSLQGAGATAGIGAGHLEELLTPLVQLREGKWTAQSKDGRAGGRSLQLPGSCSESASGHILLVTAFSSLYCLDIKIIFHFFILILGTEKERRNTKIN